MLPNLINMRKLSLLLVCLLTFISFDSFAQMGGLYGGMGRGMYGRGMYGGGMGAPMGAPSSGSSGIDIDFLAAVGYFDIDVAEALKKLKLKGDKATSEAVADAIGEYNVEYIGLMITNREDIDVLEFAKENLDDMEGDVPAMRAHMAIVGESATVVKPLLVEIHNKLNERVAALLKDNPKAQKRWTKYYEGRCNEHKFSPRLPERAKLDDAEDAPQGGRGGQGRGGRGARR